MVMQHQPSDHGHDTPSKHAQSKHVQAYEVVRTVKYVSAHPDVTIDELASFWSESPACARAHIDAANEALGACARLTAVGDGYRLQVADEEAFLAWCHKTDGFLWGDMPVTRRERVSFLINDLLVRESWVTIEALARALFCSRRTVVYDLQEVERNLERFGLVLERRPRYGVRVNGSEVKRRICMANNMLDRMADAGELDDETVARSARSDGTESPLDGTAALRDFRLDLIARCVDDAVERHGFTVNSVAYQNLLVHIAIAVSRISAGCYASDEAVDVSLVQQSDVLAVARDIAHNIAEAFHIDVPAGEVTYLAIHLAGKHVQLSASAAGSAAFATDEGHAVPAAPSASFAPASHAQDAASSISRSAISDEAWDVAGAMISAADVAFSLDLANDVELRMNLARHVGPLAVRLRYRMRLENPLLNDIRVRYPFAFACALEAARVLYEEYDAPVSDDETGYLALAFALALERRRARQTQPKNILIVCASGRGSARLLAMRCREEFGPQLGSIETCDVSQVAAADFTHIDYVFTTVPLPVEVPVPVRHVGYFLDAHDVERVHELIRSTTRCLPDDAGPRWFDRALFVPHMACATRDEVITALCARVRALLPVTGDLEALVRKREESAPTSYGNLVALPHPLQSVTERTVVCVGLLDAPVTWGERSVQAALLLCVSNDAQEDLHNFYQAMLSFVGDASAVRRLLNDQRFETLLDVMGCASNATTNGGGGIMTDEEVVMKLIVPAGEAKAHAIEAITAARKGDFEHADALIAQADEALVEAHEHQSDEIRRLLNGGASDGVSLIMVHGQDHLMNAITTIDLAKQFVEVLRERTA